MSNLRSIFNRFAQKRILVFLILFVVTPKTTFCANFISGSATLDTDTLWIPQISNTTSDLYSTYFFNNNIGWIVGAGGTILKTLDGGLNWTIKNSGLTSALYSVWFIDSLSGFVVGANGKLMLTTDGGEIWQEKNLGFNTYLNEIKINSNGIGWIVGNDGLILKTSDMGSTWQQQYSDFPTDYFTSIEIINDTTAVIVGEAGDTFRTTNGGEEWVFISDAGIYNLYSVSNPDSLTLFTCGEESEIHKSTDAGLTWELVADLTPLELYSIDFINQSTGWAVGYGGKIYHTFSGGLSWERELSYTSRNLYSVYFVNDSSGWTVGLAGTILKYHSSVQKELVLLTPNGGEYWQSGNLELISWGSLRTDKIRIQYSTDSGNSWLPIVDSLPSVNSSYAWEVNSTPTSEALVKISDIADANNFDISDSTFTIADPFHGWFKLPFNAGIILYSIFFLNENLGWICGVDGKIFKTIDGGNTWNQLSTNTQNDLFKIVFQNESIGFAFGYYDTILKTTNGGTTWSQKYINTNGQYINDAYLVDENIGYATDKGGDILKTINGGNSWFVVYSFPGSLIHTTTIFFFNSNYGIVGVSDLSYPSYSRVYKTTDGGISWESIYQFQFLFINEIEFVTDDIGWAINTWGEIFKTTNGPQAWVRKFTIPDNPWLIELHILSENKIWFVGSYGILGLVENDSLSLFYFENNISITDIQFIGQQVGYFVCSDGSIYKTINGGVIPVELINFSATLTGDQKILITWTTATETNNSGFEIQKQTGVLSDNWKTIGFIEGQGNSTTNSEYEYLDNNVELFDKIFYRLKMIDFDGTFEYSDIIEVEVVSPLEFSLGQNYPNPFNPSTNIRFTLGSRQFVSLKVYDILGNEIETLVQEEKPAGKYEIGFNTQQKKKNNSLSSGIYFYTLQAGNFVQTRKMLLLK